LGLNRPEGAAGKIPVMSQLITFKPGSLRALDHLLARYDPALVFLVTGRDSYARSGAEAKVRQGLKGRAQVRFQEFSANPNLADVEAGLRLFHRSRPDLILAVGGGSVLDMAKLIGVLSAQDSSPRDIVQGKEKIRTIGVPVIAVPTTAGSGSEATHFAVVYCGATKYSLAHPSMQPVAALIDPELTYSLPPYITAVTGLDAFCQAVESMWSVRATAPSRAYARKAVELALAHLPAAVHQPSPQVRRHMCLASLLAGKAINLTKTTAPHALSYTMTSQFGVPHGHAVALTLGPILIHNSLVTAADVTPPASVAQVRESIAELTRVLGCRDAPAASQRITGLIESLGLATRLSAVGIRTAADRQKIVDGVNPERLDNNPRALTTADLSRILEDIA
jgi:alcohol dehydrogenase class IV